MLTPAEAEALILENMPSWPEEECPLAEAHSRVLRAGIRAERDQPPFDRVTMDGYALRSSSLAAGVRRFWIERLQPAGAPSGPLGPESDACIEIMTGAVLPAGADCVVPYEDAVRAGEVAVIEDRAAGAGPGQSIHRHGSDFRAGATVVEPGARLTGREIAVAAACGCARLTVSRIPRIAIIATGDELVEVEAAVAPHQIRRSNDYALRAALAAAGFPRAERFHLRDARDEMGPRLRRVLAEFDAVLLTGGVSKGKRDFVPAELELQGVRQIFHGVAQRPGKPFWFGVGPLGTPVFALPGNPVSTYVCLHRFVLPALARAAGEPPARLRTAALAAPVRFAPKLTCLLPVRLTSGPRAEALAHPLPGNTSGDFAGLVGSDGFLELPPEPEEFPAGFVAPYRPWA
jgi:molybdopterin molybdotransferase